MNKRQRFMNFLNNKEVDRVPIAFYHHYLNSMMLYNMNQGLKNDKIFEENVVSHRTTKMKFDPDVIKVMNDSIMIMPLDFSLAKNDYDLKNIRPQGPNSPWADKTIELAKRVKEIYKDSDAPIFFTSFGPSYIIRSSFANIGNLMAGTKFFESKILKIAAEQKEDLMDLVMRVSEAVVQVNERLFKEAGIDGIYFSVNNQNNFFEKEYYREVFTPGDKLILDKANELSEMNLLHICGYRNKGNDLETFKDYKAAAYNWAVHAEGVSLKEGKEFFGGAPVFGGFEQNGVIAEGSKEEIEEAVYKILDEAGQIGIMLGADCTVPTNFDDKRLNFVVEACQKYAREHKN